LFLRMAEHQEKKGRNSATQRRRTSPGDNEKPGTRDHRDRAVKKEKKGWLSEKGGGGNSVSLGRAAYEGKKKKKGKGPRGRQLDQTVCD